MNERTRADHHGGLVVPAVAASPHQSADTRVPRRWLALVRAAWIGIVALTVVLFGLALSPRYEELQRLTLRAEEMLRPLIVIDERAMQALRWTLTYYPAAVLVLEIGLMAIFALTAAVIFWQRSDDWVALFISFGLVTYCAYVNPPLDVLTNAPTAWSGPAHVVQALGWFCAVVFFYIFPDGQFVPRWTRVVPVVMAAWVVGWLVAPGSLLNLSDPFALPFDMFVLQQAMWCTGVVIQIYRYRRVSDPVRRQQTKWVVCGVITATISYGAIVVSRLFLPALPQAELPYLLFTLTGIPVFLATLLVLPLSFSFSILRYRLWDIDVLINRALVYVALTVALALVYAGSVVLLQQFFRAVTGQRSDLALVASTLALAALFQPLRGWMQTAIDRRFYRRRYDAARTLDAFSATVRDEVDLATLTNDLVSVVQETMQPAHVSLWLRAPAPTDTPAAHEHRRQAGAPVMVD
jgi:hypothetical protein